MEDMILSVNHLSKSFGAHKVLADVDFEVNEETGQLEVIYA